MKKSTTKSTTRTITTKARHPQGQPQARDD